MLTKPYIIFCIANDFFQSVSVFRYFYLNTVNSRRKSVSFDPSKNTDAIDVKMDGSVLEEKSSLKMLGLTFSSKLD